jgi:YD repeat-containing protein
LTTDTWYDHQGRVIKTAQPGGLVIKTQYDGAGRVVRTFTTDGLGDKTWADAGTVTTNTVLNQTEVQYDGNGNALLVTSKQRFHDATNTGELSLGNARVSYAASYYDAADRLIATVDAGTNGGTAYKRPPSVPARSDSDPVLITNQTYNAAGWIEDVTDPRGIVTRTLYDNLGRKIRTIGAFTDGVPTNATNRITDYTYDGANHIRTQTARLPGGAAQTTEYVYGVTTTSGSNVNSNLLLAAIKYPDKTTGKASDAEKETFTVNALGQNLTCTDRNQTVHSYGYDVLGRLTSDAVTIPSTSSVDRSVQRLERAFDSQGNAYLWTSYDATSGGNVVNQVQRQFNGLGQLITEYQSHAGPVDPSSTPAVQYAYTEMAGGANHSRLVSMTYPNGRVLHYGYNSGLDDRISRLSFLADDDGGGGIGQHLEEYIYLGLSTIVKRAHPESGVDLTYIKQSGDPNGDAGDQYTGLDRFGRVVDQVWRNLSQGTVTDRFQYGYDRDGNILYRDNRVNPAFGELSRYDLENRLTNIARGTLNATHDGLISPPSRTQVWNLDALDNWNVVISDGTPQTRTHNQQNQITSAGGKQLTYDNNGNITRDENGQSYTYDGWNRLVRVQDANGNPLAAYSYDGLGRRITESRDSFFDVFFSVTGQVIEEQSGGTTQAQYVRSAAGGNIMVLRDGVGGRLYVQQDARNNVTALIDTTGTVVERYVYDPYGVVTVLAPDWSKQGGSAFNWNYLYQGARLDPATGLYLLRNRDYSPTLGRALESGQAFRVGDLMTTVLHPGVLPFTDFCLCTNGCTISCICTNGCSITCIFSGSAVHEGPGELAEHQALLQKQLSGPVTSAQAFRVGNLMTNVLPQGVLAFTECGCTICSCSICSASCQCSICSCSICSASCQCSICSDTFDPGPEVSADLMAHQALLQQQLRGAVTVGNPGELAAHQALLQKQLSGQATLGQAFRVGDLMTTVLPQGVLAFTDFCLCTNGCTITCICTNGCTITCLCTNGCSISLFAVHEGPGNLAEHQALLQQQLSGHALPIPVFRVDALMTTVLLRGSVGNGGLVFACTLCEMWEQEDG